MKFNEFIKSKGYTVESLANKAGISARSLEQYSSGRYQLKNARAFFVVAIAEALEISVNELIKM